RRGSGDGRRVVRRRWWGAEAGAGTAVTPGTGRGGAPWAGGLVMVGGGGRVGGRVSPPPAAAALKGRPYTSGLGGARFPLRFLLALRLLRRRCRRRDHVGVRRGARRRVAAPQADDRRGDEHARVGAGDDPHHHREREAVQHLAA